MVEDSRAAHRDARFLIVADDVHAPIARQIVEGVINSEGEVEHLAEIGFEATGHTKSWPDVPEPVRGAAPRSARDPRRAATVVWTKGDRTLLTS